MVGRPSPGIAWIAATFVFVACAKAPARVGSSVRPSAPVATAPASSSRGDRGLLGVELPPLAESATAGVVPPRPAPRIASAEEALAALRRGFHDEVAAAVAAPHEGDQALRYRLVGARLAFVRGRHDEAAREAEALARAPSLRVEALTLAGECHAARGDLASAERVLRPLVDEASAHRARIVLARVLDRRGRHADAIPLYRRLADAYNDERIAGSDAEGLSYVAIAAWALGSVRDANQAFSEAARADRHRAETQVEWARLFLAKYDLGHAEECLRDALAENPRDPSAQALLARVRLEQGLDGDAASHAIDAALAIDPGLVAAHVTRAFLSLLELDFEAADAHLDRALATDPKDLEALSTRAAVAYLRGDRSGYERAKRAVLAVHPRYSRFYATLARFAEWEHRYPDLVRFAREALRLDPEDELAYAMLGQNLLRLGDEDEGLAALREAWDRDHYNVQVFNTLNLYDDIVPVEYVWVDRGPFRFRFHRDERAVLERYVPGTLERAYADMVARYGVRPEEPLRFELYSDSRHFSLRTTGLPNLGVQGVCFGRVVTALSPRAGPYNWGHITVHELAHVFHIELSRNRVPRWFTEGLAEVEARRFRAEFRSELDHALYALLADGRLPPLARLNEAFTEAPSAADLVTAYYAGAELVAYLERRFGFDALVRMLRLFAEDLPTATVLERALSVSVEAIDADFRRSTLERLRRFDGRFRTDLAAYRDLEARARAARASARDAGARAAHAAALLVAGRAAEAAAEAEAALALDRDEKVAHYVLARLAVAGRDPASAETHLRRILEAGADGYELRLLLARLAFARDGLAEARAALEAATRLEPERTEAHEGLLEIARRTNDDALVGTSLAAIAANDEHDRESHAALFDRAVAAHDARAIVAIGERSLFVDPERRALHTGLGSAYLELDRPADALFELDSALVLGRDGEARIELDRARALAALGRRPEGEAAARRAVALDASLASEAASLAGGRGGAP
ncbi:MAG: tetratricopeptide repeat protein [Polyangiales bacterium]